jgi:hypothetical protein
MRRDESKIEKRRRVASSALCPPAVRSHSNLDTMSLITHLKNLPELTTLLAAKKDRLVIVSDPLQPAPG